MEFTDHKEKLMSELHDRLLQMTAYDKSFNFTDEAAELMNIYQNITENEYTFRNLVFLRKRVAKLEKANKLQLEVEALLDNVTDFIEREQNVNDYEADYEQDVINTMTHREQCNADRSDMVAAKLERGEIDEENAAELRAGA